MTEQELDELLRMALLEIASKELEAIKSIELDPKAMEESHLRISKKLSDMLGWDITKGT